MRFRKEAKYLLLLSNTGFISLFLVLAFHNRFALDDFHFLFNVNTYGIIEATKLEYETANSRWLSVLLIHFLISFSQLKYFLFFFGILSLSLFISAVYLLLNNLNTSFFPRHKLRTFEKLNIAIFSVNAVFFSTIRIEESWFWFCSSCTYLWPFIFLVFGVAGIFSAKKSIGSWFLIFTGFFFLGGANESLSLIVLFLLASCFLLIRMNLIIIHSIPVKWLSQRVLFAFFFCLISFLILYNGPGIKLRQTFFDDIGLAKAFVLNFKTTAMILLLRLPQILPFVFLFSLPAYFIGRKFPAEARDKNLYKKITGIVILYILLLFVFQFPITYKTQDIAAFRALFPIGIFTIVSGSYLFYISGRNNLFSWLNSRFAFVISLGLCGLLNFSFLVLQFPKVSSYARAYDQRMHLLIENKDKEKTIQLSPLPDSGLLFSAEISDDPNHFSHQHLKKALNIKGELKVLGARGK